MRCAKGILVDLINKKSRSQRGKCLRLAGCGKCTVHDTYRELALPRMGVQAVFGADVTSSFFSRSSASLIDVAPCRVKRLLFIEVTLLGFVGGRAVACRESRVSTASLCPD